MIQILIVLFQIPIPGRIPGGEEAASLLQPEQLHKANRRDRGYRLSSGCVLLNMMGRAHLSHHLYLQRGLKVQVANRLVSPRLCGSCHSIATGVGAINRVIAFPRRLHDLLSELIDLARFGAIACKAAQSVYNRYVIWLVTI